MPQTPLPEWFARDEPYRQIAAQVNRLVRQVNTDAALLAGETLNLTRLPGAGAGIVPRRAAAGPRMCVVRITAREAGGGKYAGHIFSPNCAAAPAADLSMPEGLTDSGNNNALILNLAEDSLGGGHCLAVPCFQTGLHVGFTGETTPRAILLVQAAGPIIFPVRVSKDGGADGTASSPASWTYTVQSLDGATTLDAGVALARPRPNGSMLTQNASPAFGLAFFDSTAALRLWDAGEVPATTACT